ncbi:phosphoglycerate mutase-like protein [Schizopora paradoxa]|uniref:Phosphoglycerate mutase-like protein n=1 Tax=Schizopora paradoxa TaxID=27342 RepID=A0A0H2R0Z9_9AGAM|nr:phosphoglycerate mutase-like protein [Schizopora paradoxa]
MAGLLGVIVLALYGDSTTTYQDPYTYKEGFSKLTPLGETQEVQLGSFLRSEYLASGAPNKISSIQADIVDPRQVFVRADNGGDGGVIFNSVVALLQGLFPPNPSSRSSLANGTTVVGPFGGYQYIPIESVEPEQSIQLQGWTDCPNFEKHTKNFYESEEFKAKAKEAAPFLNEIKPYLFGIPNTLENIWNIYDYMKVNYIHNETYAYRLPPSYLAQAQALVDFHEHGVFTDVSSEGIGNVAGRAALPSIIKSLERLSVPTDPLALVVQEISYKPYISLFNITGLDATYPELHGLPNYGSALAFELRNNDEGETFLRTKFKNGTNEQFRTLHLYGHKEDIALNEFLYRLDLAAIRDLSQWCNECGQRTLRGCTLCRSELTPGNPFKMPFIENGQTENGQCSARFFTSPSSWGFTAIFSVFMLVTFAATKLIKSRKPRLSGYESLPTTEQVFDDTYLFEQH